MTKPTAIAKLHSLKSYHRPLVEGQDGKESWEQVVDRVIFHERWIWERAKDSPLNEKELAELDELKTLIHGRYILPSGRILWLAGTEMARQRESSLFNSAFTHVETVYDLVDLFWLLLQGLSVGFKPVRGTLNGFRRPLQDIQVIRSTRTEKGGLEHNVEKFEAETGVWTIRIGDSASAWAKAVGKLVAGKYNAKTLILDFSELRPSGSILKGYGWVSSGDEGIADAFKKIAKILSDRSDQLLTRIDILDIVNLLGTTVASHNLSQTAIFEYGQPEWQDFAQAKKEWWLKGKSHRQQSINTLLFKDRPSKNDLEEVFNILQETGGSEPRLLNGQEAERRSPWFKGINPEGDMILGNKSFGTLVEVNLLAFKGDKVGLEKALYLAGRMNYRHTMSDLNDGILQEAWHFNNEFLHLCGLSLTGIRSRSDLTAYDYKRMRNVAVSSAYSMAHELNSPLPKNVTCLSSSLLNKIMATEEWGEVSDGPHLPRAKYLLSHYTLPKNDPIIPTFKTAGYQVSEKPYDPESIVIKFPSKYDISAFQVKSITRKNGRTENLEINTETALSQLSNYALLQTTWSEQNTSYTVFYNVEEIPLIIDWLIENWDSFISVNFALRPDFEKEEGAFEAVTKEIFDNYVQKLKPINL